MKVLSFILLFLLVYPCRGQTCLLTGQVIDSQTNLGFAGATILLKKDSVVVAGVSANQDGTFVLPAFPVGTYTVEVAFVSYRTKTIRYVAAVNNPSPLRILFPGFCPYAERGRPACIGGHTDHLLPIAYGLPSAKTMARAKRGEVYLGGCQMTSCDPTYYCLIHKKEL